MNITTKSRTPGGWLTRIAALTCTLLLVVFLPVLTQTALADLPPRPLPQPGPSIPPPDLPPRPLPQPSTPAQPAVEHALAGAQIELHVRFPSNWQWAQVHWQALWTVVQWQDAQGYWHNVEGWQGTLDELQDGEGRKTWWVAKADLGKGPFRWVVYQGRGGDLLGASELFDTPHSAGEVVHIQVSLAP